MNDTVSHTHDFRLVSYPVRVYSGKDALENLPAEVGRHRAKRAFIICGRSVSRNTPLVARVKRAARREFRRPLRRDRQGHAV